VSASATVTIGNLLTLDVLRGADVVGGPEALAREVRMVVVGGQIRQVGELPEGTLVVFDRSQLKIEDYSADVVLRRGVGAQIAGVIAEAPPHTLPLATQRLAEKFGIALILMSKVHAATIAARLDPFARVPTVATAATLRDAVQRLSQIPGQPAELLATMSSALACPVALTDAAGRVVHGHRDAVSPDVLALLTNTDRLRSGSPQVLANPGGEVSVLAPAVANSTGGANLWFVVRLPGPSLAMVEVVIAVLGVAAVAFAAYLSSTALTSEREGRRRALVLTEIMEQADEPGQRAPSSAPPPWAGDCTDGMSPCKSQSVMYRPTQFRAGSGWRWRRRWTGWDSPPVWWTGPTVGPSGRATIPRRPKCGCPRLPLPSGGRWWRSSATRRGSACARESAVRTKGPPVSAGRCRRLTMPVYWPGRARSPVRWNGWIR